MSSSSLKSIRDDMHRESAEVYDVVTSQYKVAIDAFTGKTIGDIVVQTDDNRTPESREAIAQAKFQALHDILLKDICTIRDGSAFAKQCEELAEKLRCSTCMDREKKVAFACGHAFCHLCAAEWNTCSFNCKRPNSEKPVKFRYPLFL